MGRRNYFVKGYEPLGMLCSLPVSAVPRASFNRSRQIDFNGYEKARNRALKHHKRISNNDEKSTYFRTVLSL